MGGPCLAGDVPSCRLFTLNQYKQCVCVADDVLFMTQRLAWAGACPRDPNKMANLLIVSQAAARHAPFFFVCRVWRGTVGFNLKYREANAVRPACCTKQQPIRATTRTGERRCRPWQALTHLLRCTEYFYLVPVRRDGLINLSWQIALDMLADLTPAQRQRSQEILGEALSILTRQIVEASPHSDAGCHVEKTLALREPCATLAEKFEQTGSRFSLSPRQLTAAAMPHIVYEPESGCRDSGAFGHHMARRIRTGYGQRHSSPGHEHMATSISCDVMEFPLTANTRHACTLHSPQAPVTSPPASLSPPTWRMVTEVSQEAQPKPGVNNRSHHFSAHKASSTSASAPFLDNTPSLREGVGGAVRVQHAKPECVRGQRPKSLPKTVPESSPDVGSVGHSDDDDDEYLAMVHTY